MAINKTELLELRKRAVTKLWMRNYSYREIARELAVNPIYSDLGKPSYVTVMRDVETARAELRKRDEQEIEKNKAESIARYRAMIKQAWEDYEACLGSHWNLRPQYLRVIAHCEEKITELQGTKAPATHQLEVKEIPKIIMLPAKGEEDD